jgi:preprotein translocase subunit YajC
MLIRPQQRKEKERQKMISELRAGRRVSFAGGLMGTIVEAKEQTFMIEIAPGMVIEVIRGAVIAAIDEAPVVEAK